MHYSQKLSSSRVRNAIAEQRLSIIQYFILFRIVTDQVLSPTAAMGHSAKDDGDVHKPHFVILYRGLLSVAPQWRTIGLLLDLDRRDLNIIKSDADNIHSCLEGMLSLWLKQIDPPPSKSKIITVLRELKFNEEAQRLEEQLT